MPRFSFATKPVQALVGPALADLIWNLHSILVNPASKSGEVKSAKQRMLRVLEEAKKFSLPQMIVAPITLPPEGEEEEAVRAQLPDEAALCETCQRPVTPTFSSARTLFPKAARASSSRSFRAKHSDTRRGTASSHTAPVNLTSAQL